MSILPLQIIIFFFCFYNLRFWKYKTGTTLSILKCKTLSESSQEIIATPSCNSHKTNPIDRS